MIQPQVSLLVSARKCLIPSGMSMTAIPLPPKIMASPGGLRVTPISSFMISMTSGCSTQRVSRSPYALLQAMAANVISVIDIATPIARIIVISPPATASSSMSSLTPISAKVSLSLNMALQRLPISSCSILTSSRKSSKLRTRMCSLGNVPISLHLPISGSPMVLISIRLRNSPTPTPK